MYERCDIGGNYWDSDDDERVYEEPCQLPPTHRYRSAGMAEEHWQYQCAKHVNWLDKTICTIEPLVNSND